MKILKQATYLIVALFALLFLTSIVQKTEENVEFTELTSDFTTQRNTRRPYGRQSRPILYYSNSVATMTLQLSGDIELNPGPNTSRGSSKVKHKAPSCEECNKTVRSNNKHLLCDKCHISTHLKCAQLQNTLTQNQFVKSWICNKCLNQELPFFNTSIIEQHEDGNEKDTCEPYTNKHKEKLNELNKHISICHLNTQSMNSTFDEFQFMISEMKFDIITLSETWLKNDKNLLEYVKVPGYEFVYRNRDEKRGGGVGIYIKETINFKIRNDIVKIDETIEHTWIEIASKSTKSDYLVGVFYQPSSEDTKKQEWIEKLDSILGYVKTIWDKTVIIAGDTNIDLLKNSTITDNYREVLDTYDMTCHIDKPTRKGVKTIDHIISNLQIAKILYSDVLPCPSISDHDAPYIVVNIPTNKFETRYKYIRNMKNFDLTNFINDASTLPFSLVYTFDNADDQLDTLNKLLLSVIDNHAPLTKTKFTRPPAPWMKDIQISDLQRKRDKLRKKAHETQTESDWKDYRDVRNLIKTEIKQKKTKFYKTILTSRKNKEIWKIIHRILHPSKKTLKADPKKLNVFFNETSERLVGKNKRSDQEIIHYINNLRDCENSFALNEIIYEETLKCIKSLRNDCSTGHDNIPVNFIKPIAEYIASPLTFIINNYIKESKFPSEWKIARISPIPKIDKPIELKDYRPISILPILSKVYEKLVLKQLTKYIEEQNIYHQYQSGYRKNHSTTTLLLKLYDDIKCSMQRSELTVAIFADYSKAFDTIDFYTLISKMHTLNFSKPFLSWIFNYLSHRQHFVQIDTNLSTNLISNYGVPQGSILGPILFNLCVTDMNNLVPESECIQYADDSTIYQHCKPSDITKCINNLEKDITSISKWSNETNLIFNTNKTKYMTICSSQLSRHHQIKERKFMINCNGTTLDRVDKYKLLGMMIDDKFTFNEHIKKVLKECYSTLQILKKLKRYTSFKSRKMLVESLILSKIDYCNIIFIDLPKYQLNRLQKLQNISAGFVLQKYATQEDVVSLKWLLVNERINFNISKFIFKCIRSDEIPENLKIALSKRRTLRTNRDKLEFNSQHQQKSYFLEYATKIYNELPHDIKSNENLNECFTKLKGYFLDISFSKSLII